MTERGFLVLVDISGFTAFVTATELEHGAAVVGDLLATVMQALAPPLEIQELEGDAVFALAPDGTAASDGTLLGVLERAFVAFKDRQRAIGRDASCACRACRNVATLGLKGVVHHGRFLRQVVSGRARVAGPDVVLAHRLLKNGVGGDAYLLLTGPAVERLGLEPAVAGLRPGVERYPHFGDVPYVVVPLDAGPAGRLARTPAVVSGVGV